MVIKSLSRVLLMLIAGLLSYQVSAASKYPASDFQPKIVYQSDETQQISHPPKAQSTGAPSIPVLVIVLMLAGLVSYVYKNKYQQAKAVTIASTASTVRASEEVDPVRQQPDEVQVKRIDREHKGYRSKRFS